MTKLHIFRHGQTEWNILGKMQGHQDSQLSELGRRQASEAKSKLVGETLWWGQPGAYQSSAKNLSHSIIVEREP